MRRVLTRVGLAVLLFLAVSFMVFAALNLIGDPLFNLLGPIAGDTSPKSLALIAEAKAKYHLDDPFLIRYLRWLGDFVRGDFGVQFSSDGQPPVSNIISERAARSIMLLLLGQTFAVTIAVPWAVWSAGRANSWFDKLSTLNTFLVISIPNFALAVILKWLFAIQLGWLPLTYVAGDPWPSRLQQLILPALTIAVPAAAVYQRLLRTDLITSLQEDFILMARAKGVSRRAILWRHALRPSLFSFMTVFGINTGALIGGSVIAEQIFRVPGLGWTLVEAVLRNDLPVAMAIVMLVSTVFVAINLAVDLLYTVVDPRVRAE